jgi:MFS family permease
LISIFSVLQIRKQDIDNTQARGGSQEDNGQPASLKDLLHDRSLITFGASVVLFYLANAALLPLVSQQLTGANKSAPTAYISAAIVVAQLTMIPVSWAGTTANRWGRKPLILIAFGALLIRAILYTFSNNPLFLVSLQFLDGISSGIFPVLVVLIVADLTQGTGRFSLA